MMLSRKLFLTSLAAAGAGFRRAWADSAAKPIVSFGVMSDSHVRDDPETAEPLRRIFKHLAAEGVDAVLHCGDICELGTLAELKNVADAWKFGFPGGKNAVGKPVTPFFVFGNHDYHAASYMRGKAVTDEDRSLGILYHKEKAWQMLAGEAFPGEVFSKEINGITFIGAHWAHEGEMAEWFKKHPLDANKPVFYVQHPHPTDTCFGTWAGANAVSKDILLSHPNLFSFSGHSHITVSDDRAVWQGGFVSMGAGSARLVSVGRRAGCENIGMKKWPKDVFRHMPSVRGGKSWQASIVKVYADRVEVTRRDYLNEESLGEHWRIDFPFRHNAEAPYLIADTARAPQFPEGAKVKIAEKNGKRQPDHVKEAQVHITMPAAIGDGPYARVFYYRVEVLDAAGKVLKDRKVVQQDAALAEMRTVKTDGWCVFAKDELPRGVALRFRVYPQNTSGKEGRPITSEPINLA